MLAGPLWVLSNLAVNFLCKFADSGTIKGVANHLEIVLAEVNLFEHCVLRP